MNFVPPIDQHTGMLFAYRLFLNRDPTEVERTSFRAEPVSLHRLCRTLLQSKDFRDQMYGVSHLCQLAGQEAHDAVVWAYRLLLNRDPESETQTEFMATRHRTIAELRNAVVLSEEFRLINDQALVALRDAVVLWAFRPFCTTPAASGSFNDFLGNTTRCEFLPHSCAKFSGSVQQPPGWSNGPMHETAEWIGTLRAALEAGQRFTVVELGAGWAPWLVAAHDAGRRLGIMDIHLLGVEASIEHIEFARQNLRDNGIEAGEYRLVHGIVWKEDGVARFPRLDQPNLDYGAQAESAVGASGRETVEVPCYALATLLADLPPVVDLLHCDVQGAEADVIDAAADAIDKQVRRVVIGTHGRNVESTLLEHFAGRGWRLEHESACTYQQTHHGELALMLDGEQVWRNPRV